MKKLFAILAVLFSLNLTAQETKTIQIYNNGLTHTNIKANITYLEGNIIKEEVFYTMTAAEMWTGKMSTVIVYNGDLTQMTNFFKAVLIFAEANKDNIGAITKIEERDVSMTKVAGIKCITIKHGDEKINTNFRSINKSIEALDNWILTNKTK